MKHGCWALLVSLLALVLSQGCGGGGGEVAAVQNPDAASYAAFDDLSDLPDFNGIVDATEGAGGLWSGVRTRDPFSLSGVLRLGVVVGTPPAFRTITHETVQRFFTGDISTILQNISDAATLEEKWQVADTYFKSKGKCWIAQGAAEEFQHINEATTSVCYMSKFPVEPGISIVYVAGTELDDPTKIFAQGETTRVVKLNVTNTPDMGEEEGDGAKGGGGAPETIYFRILGTDESPDGYSVTLNFCRGETDDKDHESIETIQFDRNTGILTLGHQGIEDHGTFQSTLTAKAEESSSGVFVWDKDTDREMTVSGSFSRVDPKDNQTKTDIFNGYLKISKTGVYPFVTSKFFHKGGDHEHRGYNIVVGQGTGFKTFAIREGAGKHKFKSGYEQKASDTQARTIGFEYREDGNPPCKS